MIALDTETTGTDPYHGSRPYIVTTHHKKVNTTWEWPVNPLTRQPEVPDDELAAALQLIQTAPQLVLHNTRFDFAAIQTLFPQEIAFPWERVQDTLIAGHLLYSAHRHGLDWMSRWFLKHDISHYEQKVETAVRKARDYIRRRLPEWKIAKAGEPGMPSVKKSKGKDKDGQKKDSAWKNDMWVLKALEHAGERKKFEEWAKFDSSFLDGERGDGIVHDYADEDSSTTDYLWPVCEAELKRRDLWGIYLERMKLLPIAYSMERLGLTLSADALLKQTEQYRKGIETSVETCVRIAKSFGFDLPMPKGDVNNALRAFCFGEAWSECPRCHHKWKLDRQYIQRYKDVHGNKQLNCGHCGDKSAKVSACIHEQPWLNLPSVEKKTDSGDPSLAKEAIEEWRHSDLTDIQREFIEALSAKAQQTKATQALEGYQRFWLPGGSIPLTPPAKEKRWIDTGLKRRKGAEVQQLWMLLHPNLNPTGSDTLRWSSSNPNLQNISKQKDFNLRAPFGPPPGEEDWSLDFKNVELRIPSYEAQEPELIALFEDADSPPFYGSQHMLNFSIVYPDIWKKELLRWGPEKVAEFIKDKKEGYGSTNYQWIKNTDFALQYNCGRKKADATAHCVGAFDLLKSRFAKQEALNQWCISYARKHGYVETIPDRSVNPRHGYPLMVDKVDGGGVMPTQPLNYRVSGTAMWLTGRAMVKCQAQLDEWNREHRSSHPCSGPKEPYRMLLQVHDELFFRMPKAAHPKERPGRSNLARVRILQRLMAENDLVITIPTPVGAEYHEKSWDIGIVL